MAVDDGNVDAATLSCLRQALRIGPAPRLAVLFGSATTGRLRPSSDLDVAVLASGAQVNEAWERELFGRLAAAVKRDVDLVRLDTGSTLLRWQVASHGVLLHEESPGEFARFRARAAAEYADFAPAFAHHGEIFRRRLIKQGGPA